MMAKYLSQDCDHLRYEFVPINDVLVLHGMFSLAARFSTSEYFAGTPLDERGELFAAKALSIIQGYLYGPSKEATSLQFLQGLILVSNYSMIKGPERQAWFLTGDVCRMAQLLSLHNVDHDILTPNGACVELSASEWACREERRRAWWEVVRLDNFASVTTQRPFNIDSSSMSVLLPVSDENWFGEQPLSSAHIHMDLTTTLKSLAASENQSPYAYFLIALSLMSAAYRMTMTASTILETIEDMDTCLSCFVLSLPERFSLEGGNFCYVSPDLAHGQNWIIGTHLVIQNARSFLIYLHTQVRINASIGSGLETVSSSAKADELALLRSRPLLTNLMRILRQWPPDHIPLASPLLVCALLGPFNYIMRCIKTVTQDQTRIALMRNLVALALTRVANYWHIGSLVLGEFDFTIYH